MQTYKDWKLTCEVFLCSLSSYNFVIYILSQLNIHKSNSFFPLKNHHINSSNNLSYDFSRSIKLIWGSLLASLYLSFRCLCKKIVGIKPNWFFDIVVSWLNLYSITLSQIFCNHQKKSTTHICVMPQKGWCSHNWDSR